MTNILYFKSHATDRYHAIEVMYPARSREPFPAATALCGWTSDVSFWGWAKADDSRLCGSCLKKLGVEPSIPAAHVLNDSYDTVYLCGADLDGHWPSVVGPMRCLLRRGHVGNHSYGNEAAQRHAKERAGQCAAAITGVGAITYCTLRRGHEGRHADSYPMCNRIMEDRGVCVLARGHDGPCSWVASGERMRERPKCRATSPGGEWECQKHRGHGGPHGNAIYREAWPNDATLVGSTLDHERKSHERHRQNLINALGVWAQPKDWDGLIDRVRQVREAGESDSRDRWALLSERNMVREERDGLLDEKDKLQRKLDEVLETASPMSPEAYTNLAHALACNGDAQPGILINMANNLRSDRDKLATDFTKLRNESDRLRADLASAQAELRNLAAKGIATGGDAS